MVITQPTVDDFSDTTVMRVIRKIVNYICNDLVDGINNGDIVSGKFSVRGNRLSGTLTKGDGTTIDIPAVTLPDGGGSDNPYPTGVDLSVSGNNLSINIPMSGASALKDTVALPSGGDANGLTMNANGKVDVSSSDTGVNYQIKSSGNNMTLVGNIVVGATNNAIYNDSTTIVNSVSVDSANIGEISVTVNGVRSSVNIDGLLNYSGTKLSLENNGVRFTREYWDSFSQAYATTSDTISLQDLANALKPYLS